MHVALFLSTLKCLQSSLFPQQQNKRGIFLTDAAHALQVWVFDDSSNASFDFARTSSLSHRLATKPMSKKQWLDLDCPNSVSGSPSPKGFPNSVSGFQTAWSVLQKQRIKTMTASERAMRFDCEYVHCCSTPFSAIMGCSSLRSCTQTMCQQKVTTCDIRWWHEASPHRLILLQVDM